MSGEMIGDLLSVGGKVQEECDRLRAELEARVLERDEALRRQAESMAEERCLRVELADFKLQLKEAAAVDTPTNEQLAPWRQVAELQAQLQEAEAERDHQKELLAVFRTQQRLIDAIFRNLL